ncbi:hypothetical protein L1887_56040 [Cichorium endivia]|nr:hypothetical protein L1887_56040 [Cichorium endivia]
MCLSHSHPSKRGAWDRPQSGLADEQTSALRSLCCERLDSRSAEGIQGKQASRVNKIQKGTALDVAARCRSRILRGHTAQQCALQLLSDVGRVLSDARKQHCIPASGWQIRTGQRENSAKKGKKSRVSSLALPPAGEMDCTDQDRRSISPVWPARLRKRPTLHFMLSRARRSGSRAWAGMRCPLMWGDKVASQVDSAAAIQSSLPACQSVHVAFFPVESGTSSNGMIHRSATTSCHHALHHLQPTSDTNANLVRGYPPSLRIQSHISTLRRPTRPSRLTHTA